MTAERFVIPVVDKDQIITKKAIYASEIRDIYTRTVGGDVRTYITLMPRDAHNFVSTLSELLQIHSKETQVDLSIDEITELVNENNQ